MSKTMGPVNADAIALLEQWYATLDAKPPGYWEGLLAEIEAERARESPRIKLHA